MYPLQQGHVCVTSFRSSIRHGIKQHPRSHLEWMKKKHVHIRWAKQKNAIHSKSLCWGLTKNKLTPWKPLGHLPHEEAEQAEKWVHEADVMANACDDGLLAVWTHCLHWTGLEHLTLKDRHCCGCPRRGNNCGRVPSSRAKATGRRTKLPWHHLWIMTWWWIIATCNKWKSVRIVLHTRQGNTWLWTC